MQLILESITSCQSAICVKHRTIRRDPMVSKALSSSKSSRRLRIILLFESFMQLNGAESMSKVNKSIISDFLVSGLVYNSIWAVLKC